jgi:hypothetical protein
VVEVSTGVWSRVSSLCRAGGARSAREHALATEREAPSGRALLLWVAVGAFLGIIAAHSPSKLPSLSGQALLAILGGVIGFGTSVVLTMRHAVAEAVRNALLNINRVRDAHWLAKHPIDYA